MATGKTPLRAVAADEKPEPKRILTLQEAIDLGDELEILLAQRREIVRDLPDEKGPAKAALHRLVSILSKEIAAMELRAKEDGADAADVAADEDWTAEAL